VSGQPYCYECGVDREGDWLCDACRPETTDTSEARIAALEAANERLSSFCAEFIWGEDNPGAYSTVHNLLEQAEATINRMKWQMDYMNETLGPLVEAEAAWAERMTP